jgi:hypothetical protein
LLIREAAPRLTIASIRDESFAQAFHMTSSASRARATREDESDMNVYTIVSSSTATNEAMALSARLSAWHDAMVAHERRMRTGSTGDRCYDECPHAHARELWSEAVATFGARAEELTFLRSRAREPRRFQPALEEHARFAGGRR